MRFYNYSTTLISIVGASLWKSTAVQAVSTTSSDSATTATAATNDANGQSTPTTPPSWDELDARPLPDWYDDAKFGIFLHWGVFSVPAYISEWLWAYTDAYTTLIQDTERPGFSYQEYATRFTAELYRPDQWAEWFAQSGAQYVVMTSKHHEGYCNWNSKDIPTTWNWNVMDVGPKRDILGDLATQVKKQTSPYTGKRLKFGVYHSLYEWYNPLYQTDKANGFATQHFVDSKTVAELYDLVRKYEPELIWSDGEWEANSTYWKAREFLHWYATNSTVAETAVWNDRWGSDTLCKHGGFLTCTDRYSPDALQPKKWENAFTIDTSSWGWNRNSTMSNYMSAKELVHTLVQVVAFNGNVLINIGPGADGTISPIFIDRLLGMGTWLKVNGEAIYGTRPWNVCQNETASSVFYTKKSDHLYAHFTQWPADNTLLLQFPIPTTDTEIRFLGMTSNSSQSVKWRPLYNQKRETVSVERSLSPDGGGFEIVLPALTPNLLPCEHSWVLAMTGIANL